MSKAFTEISEALQDAIAHSKGQDVGVVEPGVANEDPAWWNGIPSAQAKK